MDKNRWFKLLHILEKLTRNEDELSLFKESITLLKKEFEKIDAEFFQIILKRNPPEKKSIPTIAYIRDALDPKAPEELLENYGNMNECYIARKPFIIESQSLKHTVFMYPLIAQKDVQYLFKAVVPHFYDHTDPVLRYFFNTLFNFYSAIRSNERDFLTGLYNRKAFDRVMSGLEFDPDRSPDLKDFLIILDIDFFKNINDNYGHMIGDEVLILFGRLLVDSIRTQDSVFRTGGEEFVILARQLTHENAVKATERLRSIVENTQFPQAGKLTISIGFAHIEHPVDVYYTLKKADRALYYAKEHGRNLSLSYETLVEEGKIKSVDKISDIIDIW